MSFTLLPTIGPWMVGFAVVVLVSAALAVVAVVDAVRTHRRAVVVPVTSSPAPTARPVRRTSTRLHHA